MGLERRGKRRWKAVAPAPVGSTSSCRRRFRLADLLSSSFAVGDTDGRDPGSQEGEAGREQHAGAEGVLRSLAEFGSLLILGQGHRVFPRHLRVEDEGDDEPDDGYGDQAAEAGYR